MIPINELKRGFDAYASEYESKALSVLRSGWYVLGNEVSGFEEEFAQYMNSTHCIGVDNGLNAIVLGIKALGIGCGDEVIVQANTYIATVLGVSLNGATPVFVDANRYHNIDPNKIQSAITPRTKAVLVTHLYGQASEMNAIIDVCRENDIYLLEDCAQAHGAQYDGKYVGTFGIMGFFSFYPTKNLGCFGDGGAILTDNDELNKKLRALRNYGSVKRYQNEYEGSNSRLDEIQAGLLRVKLRHFDELTAEKKKFAQRYLQEIANPEIELPIIAPKCTHVFHLFVIQTNDREKFRKHLADSGIMTDIHYPTPPYLGKPYIHLGYTTDSFPVTKELYGRIVSIPIFNFITNDEVTTIINAINNYAG